MALQTPLRMTVVKPDAPQVTCLLRASAQSLKSVSRGTNANVLDWMDKLNGHHVLGNRV